MKNTVTKEQQNNKIHINTNKEIAKNLNEPKFRKRRKQRMITTYRKGEKPEDNNKNKLPKNNNNSNKQL